MLLFGKLHATLLKTRSYRFGSVLMQACRVLLLVVVVTGCRSAPVTDGVQQRPVLIEVAKEIGAGEPAVVTVRGEGDRTVELVWRDGYATRQFSVEMRAGVGTLEIGDTETAGVATITVEGVVADINIAAGHAIEPIIPLVAPKTIVVGSDETSMGVVVPFDTFGNLVQSGTPITFTVRRSNGAQTRMPTTVQNGVGWRAIGSGRLAGETSIVAEVGTASSTRARLNEVPNEARQIELVNVERMLMADGRTRIPLQTEPLRDRFGNLLTDGALVEFVVAGLQSTARLSGVVIGGIAETTLLAPTEPQTVSVTARIGAVESAPLTLAFKPFVAPFAITLVADEAQNGLIVTSDTLQNGAIVPDRTAGKILVVRDGILVRQISAETVQGRISQTIYFTDALNGTYTIYLTVGGRTAKGSITK
jgi:hypothetical protein